MAKCSFCGYKLREGTGKMFVSKSNVVRYFCTRKCEKYFGMGKNPKKLKWTEHYIKGK